MFSEDQLIPKAVMAVAENMVIAARTAPKGKGINNIFIMLAGRDDIKKISEHMQKMGKKFELPGFLRDADNILNADLLFLIGTKIEPLGLKYCGLCGFGNCDEKRNHPNVPCVFNTGDMGIAIGSAVSVAANARIDNRIMYSVGMTAIDMSLFGKDIKIAYGIPLSSASKNPFFDRK